MQVRTGTITIRGAARLCLYSSVLTNSQPHVRRVWQVRHHQVRAGVLEEKGGISRTSHVVSAAAVHGAAAYVPTPQTEQAAQTASAVEVPAVRTNSPDTAHVRWGKHIVSVLLRQPPAAYMPCPQTLQGVHTAVPLAPASLPLRNEPPGQAAWGQAAVVALPPQAAVVTLPSQDEVVTLPLHSAAVALQTAFVVAVHATARYRPAPQSCKGDMQG